MEMSTSCLSNIWPLFPYRQRSGQIDTCQRSTDPKCKPLCFITHMISAHLTQVFAHRGGVGPSGSLGKHSILMDQGVTGISHGQRLDTGCSSCYWMLRHQDTITQSRKEERFEECLGIPQEDCRDFSSCVSRREGEEVRQAVRLMQKRIYGQKVTWLPRRSA